MTPTTGVMFKVESYCKLGACGYHRKSEARRPEFPIRLLTRPLNIQSDKVVDIFLSLMESGLTKEIEGR